MDFDNLDSINKELYEQQREYLKPILNDIPDNKKAVATDLIDSVSFMTAVLEMLESDITENGIIQTYDNGGGQTGQRISPAIKSYNSLMKTYTLTVKTLFGMLPKINKDKSKENADRSILKAMEERLCANMTHEE